MKIMKDSIVLKKKKFGLEKNYNSTLLVKKESLRIAIYLLVKITIVITFLFQTEYNFPLFSSFSKFICMYLLCDNRALIISGIVLYFRLAYSDPGFLSEDKDVKINLDAKILKSIEEVIFPLFERRKKNEEEVNYGYEAEIKDNQNQDYNPNEVYYSEKNQKVVEINFEHDNDNQKKETNLKRAVFSTKNVMRKKFDLTADFDEKSSEKKRINISVLEGEENENGNHVARKDIDNNEDGSQRSNSKFNSGYKRNSKPLLEIKIEENNRDKVSLSSISKHSIDITETKDVNISNNRLINKSNLELCKVKSCSNTEHSKNPVSENASFSHSPSNKAPGEAYNILHSISPRKTNEGFSKIEPPDTKRHTADETSMLEGFCGECVCDIPIRAKHCKICKKCVATFDHHCDWVGNCIGEKNKSMFILFVLNHVVEIFLTLIFVTILIKKSLLSVKSSTSTKEWLGSNFVLFINILAESLFFVFVISLLVLHLYLLMINQTTCTNKFTKGKTFVGTRSII